MKYVDKIPKVNYFANLTWSEVNTPRYWFKNEPIITHMFNAFSLLIPEAEYFIVRAIKPIEKSIHDPEIVLRIKAFLAEEFTHSLQHTRFNNDLKRYKYPIDFLSRFLRVSYRALGKCVSKKTNIAISVCFEHFTVMFAHTGFDKETLEPGGSAIQDLFLWHAYEELSHRSFLMDLYHHIGGGYIRRIWAMLISTAFVFLYIAPVLLFTLLFSDFYQRRGLSFRNFIATFKFMWSVKGFFKYYMAYYKYNFKPEDVDIVGTSS